MGHDPRPLQATELCNSLNGDWKMVAASLTRATKHPNLDRGSAGPAPFSLESRWEYAETLSQ